MYLVSLIAFCYIDNNTVPQGTSLTISIKNGKKYEKKDESLFQIGEIAKILGVTRKAILIYEEKGLLTPAVKDEVSGYRYYTADNMTQIRSIRSLQALGLSLNEIAEYYYSTDNIDDHLQKLMELRAAVDRNIQMLQVRAAKSDDLTVHRTTLPQQICFARRYQCRDVAEAANRLRDTYIAAARTGLMSMVARMFTMRMSQDFDVLDLMCCIPVESSFMGDERMEFAETPALCIYFRGAYEENPMAFHALQKYIKDNNICVTGAFRSIYLEGPPSRGENTSDYITQIAVPVKL